MLDNLTDFLHKNSDIKKLSKEDIKSGLEVIFNNAVTIIFVLSFSYLIGSVIEAFLVLRSFAFLRTFSGGYHLKTAIGCTVYSTAMILSILTISKYIHINLETTIFLNVFTFLLVLIFAPVEIDKMFKIKFNYFFLFKIISIIIVLSNILFFKSELLTITYFIQSLTLIKVFKKRS